MLLLFFIFVRDITFASTMALSKSITQYNEIYLLLFYFLQVIASPLQASFSDHSYRRKSLVFAFSIIFVGHLFLFISLKVGVLFLLICFVLNGFFGNVLPIAIASLMDMDYLKNTKKLMAFVTATLAVAWLGYVYGMMFFKLLPFFWITTGLCFVCIILAFYCFKDVRDKDRDQKPFSVALEVSEIFSFMKTKWFLFAIKGYFITELVYYTLFYYHILELDNSSLIFIATTYSIGYILGVFVIILLNRMSIIKGISIGLSLAVVSIISLIIFTFNPNYMNNIILILLTTLFSFGYGIFDPCLYVHFGKNQLPHKRGKIFGIVDSADNCSEMFSTVILLFLQPSLLFLRSMSIFFIVIAFICVLLSIKNRRKLVG
jgi:MFS family permease